MRHFFGKEGLQELSILSRYKTLYAFDFDGTLAALVEDPWKASMSAGTSRYLSDLSQIVPTAVISGRSVSDLRMRIQNDNIRLIGNHGVEGLSPIGLSSKAIQQICESWKDQIFEKYHETLHQQQIAFEDKTFSLAWHYRKAKDQMSALGQLKEMAAALDPVPRVILGKTVVNLVPDGAPDKGAALLELMSLTGVGRALYVGDDDTDEDIFRLNDPRLTTVRVEEGESKASYFLKDREEVDHLIQKILELAASINN